MLNVHKTFAGAGGIVMAPLLVLLAGQVALTMMYCPVRVRAAACGTAAVQQQYNSSISSRCAVHQECDNEAWECIRLPLAIHQQCGSKAARCTSPLSLCYEIGVCNPSYKDAVHISKTPLLINVLQSASLRSLISW